ncbi:MULTISPECIES: group II intron reverse transcriptase/maturase [Arenibacter]|jgi:group II intron reverse transcriptase/maturase|uniref:RNA-directed DNA polymerase n=1 Tax=Arenibacter algicola TaxID=616991 RepID=A0A221UUV2_9FLAO|nr:MULTISPECIES: group II intron reverse transcriptase/maturase [Arenibacter]ASO05060.1 group II intron-encoded protein LtrA [Arenibacter algicola]ASO05117.1 group II intron-encoded protein LtrA [Arenibacter algicola]ASO07833.1 group II intron-encoded protein LtrA [Arenibacter algicola]MCM4163592.1 group II intron reverse transcriptase/maturase [Arenibacter sp. A80]RFT56323.1 group II intron reverse transcriptase/maturase [Arenibacter sp. P308M17]|tara:strand:- start:81 stop:1487 length:1407 start_codon:yes stop_codon:yes gene_type:complete
MNGRTQKISIQETCPQKNRTASEGYVGGQTFLWITENNLTDTNQLGDGLLELIVSPSNLNKAYLQVKRNKGSGGVDKMEVESLKDYLVTHKDKLIASILKGTYRPNPVRRVLIPKDNGQKRQLGIPTVIDRCIQQAIAQVLSPMYEPQFSDNSYGFRPRRNAHGALRKCQAYITEGYKYAVDLDLEKFFDTVNHSKLIEILSRTVKDGRVISLIHKYLNAGVQVGSKIRTSEEGVPQGGPLSPILSNIMLNEMDKELESREHKFVRYADDLLILCRSKRSAERTMGSMIHFIEDKLFLKVNRDKSQSAHIRKVKFLGYSFHKSKGEGRLRIHRKSVAKMKAKIKELTSRSNGWGNARRKEALRQYITGWVNYFKLADMKNLLLKIDEWYRRRIRMVIWKQWKRIRTGVKNLIKLGVKKSKAWEWANTRKSYWHTANSFILKTTITTENLRKAGYVMLSDQYRKVSIKT